MRRRLQSELAALPQQLISYEELLAFFVDYGSCAVGYLWLMGGDVGASFPEIRAAAQLAAELLPQLAPDDPKLLYTAASTAQYASAGLHAASAAGSARHLTMITAALDVAQQQGNDYYTASCGYLMAMHIRSWVAEPAMRKRLPPPSAVLGWLQQAEAAHRRCKALLPKQWTSQLDVQKGMAASAKDWLQQLQQQGNRWRRLTPAAQQELSAARQGYIDRRMGSDGGKKFLMCSGCGSCAAHLRLCGAYREAQYCR